MNPIVIQTLDASSMEEASGLLAEFKQTSYGLTQTPETFQSSLFALLEGKFAYVLLAYIDGAPAGFLSYSWSFSTSKGQPILRIQDVYVSDSARRKGVGQDLLRHAADIGRANGAHRLQLETDTDNEAARALYEKVGFEWIAHKEVYMRPLQEWPS